MDFKAGDAIGPWTILDVKLQEPYRTVATVIQPGIDDTQWILKICIHKTELDIIHKYKLYTHPCAIRMPHDELLAFGIHDRKHWFVMEKFNNDCLDKGKYEINESEFMKAVLKFLKPLHREHKLIHGDLKLNNVLYKDGEYIVCDYDAVREPENSTVCDESNYDNYYYYSYGAEYNKPIYSYRYDFQAIGYMLMQIHNNYDTLLFQKSAHRYYNNKYKVNKFNVLEILRNSYEMPANIKAYFAIVEKVDWYSIEPPEESIYDEILSLYTI